MTTHYDVIKLSGVQATWLAEKFNPREKNIRKHWDISCKLWLCKISLYFGRNIQTSSFTSNTHGFLEEQTEALNPETSQNKTRKMRTINLLHFDCGLIFLSRADKSRQFIHRSNAYARHIGLDYRSGLLSDYLNPWGASMYNRNALSTSQNITKNWHNRPSIAWLFIFKSASCSNVYSHYSNLNAALPCTVMLDSCKRWWISEEVIPAFL